MADDSMRTPEEMLALMRDQQRSVSGQMGAFVPLILLSWGVAWMLGFGALRLVDGWGGLSLPIAVAGPIFVVLLAGAGVVSTLFGIRSSRGLRGGKEGAFAGVVYGQLWWIGGVSIFVLGQALVQAGMSADVVDVFYPSAYIWFVGLMYCAGAAIWRAVPMLILGVWSIVIAAAAPFAGRPDHLLVYAFGGGGGFLVAALWTWVWTHRARRRLSAGEAHD